VVIVKCANNYRDDAELDTALKLVQLVIAAFLSNTDQFKNSFAFVLCIFHTTVAGHFHFPS